MINIKRLPILLMGCAFLLAMAMPTLNWLHAIESDTNLGELNPDGLFSYVIWNEQVVTNPNSNVVTRININRQSAQSIADDLFNTNAWGLFKTYNQFGQILGNNVALKAMQFEQSLTTFFNLARCDPSELRLFSSSALEGQNLLGSEFTSGIGEPANSDSLRLISNALDTDLFNCTLHLDSGEYLLVVMAEGSASEEILKQQLAQLSNELHAGFISQRYQIRSLDQFIYQQQSIKAEWLHTTMLSLRLLLMAVITGLIALHFVIKRKNMAIEYVFGCTAKQQIIKNLQQVFLWIFGGCLIGFLLSVISANYMIKPFSTGLVVDGLAIILLSLLITTYYSVRIIKKLGDRPDSLMQHLHGSWSTKSSLLLFTFWSLITATLVAISVLQASIYYQINSIATIDWGFDPQGLTALTVQLPDSVKEDSIYKDRLDALLNTATTYGPEPSVSMISDPPWRYSGLSRVSGDFILTIGVGPNFLETLDVSDYSGRDFDPIDMVDGIAHASQGLSDNERENFSFLGQEIAVIKGYRWDPFEPVAPKVIFQPITNNIAQEFDLIWRTNDSSWIPGPDAIDQFRQVFPEAVFGQPQRVENIIKQRYGDLIWIANLGILILFMSILTMLVLTALTIRQILSQEQRALAIRVALGASLTQALGPWLKRATLAILIGITGGLYLTTLLNQLLQTQIEGFEAQILLGAIAAIGLISLIMVIGLCYAFWLLQRLDLSRLLAE